MIMTNTTYANLPFREKTEIHDIMALLLTPDIILPVMQKSLLGLPTVNMKKVRGGTQIIDKTAVIRRIWWRYLRYS